jgi:hypothetical protein
LLDRARQEREAAATSESNAVAKIHLDLADAYEKRATTLAERLICENHNAPSPSSSVHASP